jgi:hypothetical protein
MFFVPLYNMIISTLSLGLIKNLCDTVLKKVDFLEV